VPPSGGSGDGSEGFRVTGFRGSLLELALRATAKVAEGHQAAPTASGTVGACRHRQLWGFRGARPPGLVLRAAAKVAKATK